MGEVWLDLKNTPLVKVLRDLMPECDELHDELVTINAQHVFRHWDEVKTALAERKERIEVLRSGNDKKNTRDFGTSMQENDLVENKPEPEEKKNKKNKILELGLVELETQVDEIQVLLACAFVSLKTGLS